ncbi:MAG: tetratricopeptide repeat protein, partial [Planctomycetota bacterium]|nr:tetratricopeptide repeat protein [Planctomycetota bacterium]
RFIEEHGADTMAIGQIRVVLARAHLMEGNSIQASRIYQLALQEPTVHSPVVYYGLSLARSRGLSAASGEMALMSSAVLSNGEDVRLRIELGKLALGDQDHRRAIAYLSNVLRWQPDNVTALVLLGEAQNLALKAGENVDPLRTFSTVLARNPGNTRARLGLARSQVIHREFEDAVDAYEGLVAQDATYAFARREYARALYWDHRYSEAFEAYDELLAGLPAEAIAVDVFGSGSPGSGLRAELDFEAELELSEAVRLELDAKMNRDWRPELSISALKRLVVIEPANQEARFELAQLLHRRGRTSRALAEYEDLLEVSGGHSEAKEALAGARREISPHLDVMTGSEERDGRDGLALLDESWTLTDVAFPFGDRDDYLGLGIGQRSYSSFGEDLHANVLRLFGSNRIGDNTTISGQIEVPSYDRKDLLQDRVYYDLGLRYVSASELAVDLRVFSEPVAQNFVTLDRDINRGGARVGLTKKASRRFDYGGSVLFANYSDENSQFEGNIFAAYEFNPAPQEFRVLVKGDFLSFGEESVAPPNPLDLSSLAVPYFSPKGYSIYSVQADWKHQFGPDWFTGSKDMYYRATTRGAIDSNSVGFFELQVGAAYDFTDWLGIEAGVRMLRSSALDLTSSNALLTVRWP